MSVILPHTDGKQRVLYILDAAHRVEEELLDAWIDIEVEKAKFHGETVRVVIPISQFPENIPSEVLVAQLKLPPDTMVIPVRVVWRTSVDGKSASPRLRDLIRGNRHRPGPWRARKILRRQPERAKCIAAEAASLSELRDRHIRLPGDTTDDLPLAEFIAGQAGVALDVAERKLHGSRYKVPRRVATSLMVNPRLEQAMAEISAEHGVSLTELRREAAVIMGELIAVPHTFWIDFLAAFARRMRNLGYEKELVVDQTKIERIRQLTRQHPAALVFTHKTHVDGFAMNTLLYDNDFPAPHTLGGLNMAFAGLGYVGRRAGAIFIRRSFNDNKLYKTILRLYIGYLLEKRFPLSWAFEGTRSRGGKLMPPRYGLIKYVVEAAHATDASNLHFIPVAINYDLIGDVADYAREQAGEDKRPESLRWFIGYLRGLRQPMGRIYIDIGEPVVLKRAPSGEDSLALQKVAFQIGVEANKVTPITLVSLVTMILLGAAPRALTQEELIGEIQGLVAWARERNIHLTSDFEPENRARMTTLSQVLIDNGMLTRYDAGPEVVYTVSPEQHGVASYYRNSTMHHFVNKAIIELALLHCTSIASDRTREFWYEAERLRDTFKFEFFYAPTDEFRVQVREELIRAHPNWEGQLDSDPDFAQRILNEIGPLVAHGTLLSFVEAYRVVADVLAGTPEDVMLEEKDCLKAALKYGRQALLQRRISSEASISKLLFQNGYKLMANRGLTDTGSAELIVRRKQHSRDLRELAHKIDTIRTMALSR